MPHQFSRHYTLPEARLLLPRVREWLSEVRQLRTELERKDERLMGLLAEGQDLGGERVNGWIRLLARLRELLLEFQRREIQIKDLKRGLVDFPSFRGDQEVFLCWEEGEEDIEFWHDLESGFAGREPL